MTVTNELTENNETYVAAFGKGHLSMPPSEALCELSLHRLIADRRGWWTP